MRCHRGGMASRYEHRKRYLSPAERRRVLVKLRQLEGALRNAYFESVRRGAPTTLLARQADACETYRRHVWAGFLFCHDVSLLARLFKRFDIQ